ncbi:MAG: hypothetical protein JKY50_22460 [Oleispira sp.]|nr:hypothetical protein [Oleispira sp.]
MEIEEYIRSYDNQPAIWGESDCSSWAAKWYELATGNKPKLPTYTTRTEAHELIEKAGGLVALWDTALEGFGLERYGEPELGDVGVIITKRFGDIGGIFGERGLFFWRSENGVAVLQPRTKTIKKIWCT